MRATRSGYTERAGSCDATLGGCLNNLQEDDSYRLKQEAALPFYCCQLGWVMFGGDDPHTRFILELVGGAGPQHLHAWAVSL